ncbi:MAG: WD40 repeat domain-containing protein, partial [Thermocrispum sp.]
RVAAAGYDAGALPLLSHALLSTWQRRSGGKLTIAGYRAAGGIHGAVAATAERTWKSLDGAEQAAARRILLHLVQVGDTTRDVRRRSTRSELIAGDAVAVRAAERALEVLAAARLVTLDADAVEISHEALLEAWPRLRGWIDHDRAENLLRQRLESDAKVWDGQDRDASLLYRGARLESTTRLSQVPTTSVARAFLAASARGVRRTRWLRRAGVALVCVLALIAVTAAAIAIDQRDEAEFQQIVTESDTLRATDPSLSAQVALVAHRERPADTEVNGRLLAMQHAPLATPLRGHSAAVYLGKFRPDGRLLATASEDRTVQLWRIPQRGRPVPVGAPLTGHDGWVGTAVFSPDGRTLATAGEDGTVRLWDVSDPANPRPLGQPLDGDHGIIYMLDFSPDGRILATANGDGTVRIWDVADPAAPRWRGRLTGHRQAVRSVSFSAEGTMLASGSDDHDVRLWQVSGTRITPLGEPLRGAADKVHAAVFSPDDKTLAVGVEDGTVWLWDIGRDLGRPSSPQPIGGPLAGHEGLVWELAFSPDGRTLASASSDGTARLWNVAD